MAKRFSHRIEEGCFVREWGAPGTRPTVLWIHGLGESGLCFETTVADEELAEYHHLIPDLPGYGRSAWPDRVPSLATLADQLAYWLMLRGAGPVVVVGHSMGGVIAQLLAERHPSRLRALVNVEGNLTYDECTFSGPAAAGTLEQFLVGGFNALRDWVYRTGLEDEAHRGYYVSLRLADPGVFHAHAIELVGMARKGDLAERLGALSLPHVYVAGVPDGVSEGALKLLREAEVPVLEVEHAGHWPFLDRPSRFCRILAEFLGWEDRPEVSSLWPESEVEEGSTDPGSPGGDP